MDGTGSTASVLPGPAVDSPAEGRVPLNLPPQGLSGDPLGPHGLRPVGFFICGGIRCPIG